MMSPSQSWFHAAGSRLRRSAPAQMLPRQPGRAPGAIAALSQLASDAGTVIEDEDEVSRSWLLRRGLRFRLPSVPDGLAQSMSFCGPAAARRMWCAEATARDRAGVAAV